MASSYYNNYNFLPSGSEHADERSVVSVAENRARIVVLEIDVFAQIEFWLMSTVHGKIVDEKKRWAHVRACDNEANYVHLE